MLLSPASFRSFVCSRASCDSTKVELQYHDRDLIYELDVLPETLLTLQHLTKRETPNEKNLNHKIAA